MRNKTSYVAVSREPSHKEIWKNSSIRIYRACLPAGGETQYHRHSENTLYIVCRGGKIKTTGMKGGGHCPTILPKSVTLKSTISLFLKKVSTGYLHLSTGFLFCMPSHDSPLIHKAKASPHNTGNMNLLGIELFHGNHSVKPQFQPHKSLKHELDFGGVTLFRLLLDPEQVVRDLVFPGPCLLVSVQGRMEIGIDSGTMALLEGDCRWFPAKGGIQVKNGIHKTDLLILLL